MKADNEPVYYVLLLPSVSHVMKAEKILIGESIPMKIIPMPKTISSDCGVCIRFEDKYIDDIKTVLKNQFEGMEFVKL